MGGTHIYIFRSIIWNKCEEEEEYQHLHWLFYNTLGFFKLLVFSVGYKFGIAQKNPSQVDTESYTGDQRAILAPRETKWPPSTLLGDISFVRERIFSPNIPENSNLFCSILAHLGKIFTRKATKSKNCRLVGQ